MDIFIVVILVLAAVYCFAAVAYYYAFRNWSPMCGSHKSPSGRGIRWITAKQERGKKGGS